MLCRIVSLLAISACIQCSSKVLCRKISLSRSVSQSCKVLCRIISLVVLSSRVREFLGVSLLASQVGDLFAFHLCNGYLKRCFSVCHRIGTGESHSGRVKGFETCFEVVNYRLKLSRRQHDHRPAILQMIAQDAK